MPHFKNYVTLIVLVVTSVAFAQDSINFKKPVELEEIIISKDKKQKLTKIKFGNPRKEIYILLADYLDKRNPTYLIDDLPECTLKTIKLFFADTRISTKSGKHLLESYVINKTDFHLYLYENNDGKIGGQINSEPILVSVAESKNDNIKNAIIDLSSFNIRSKSFYVRLEKITPTPCDECYFYLPILYTSGKNQVLAEETTPKRPIPQGIIITNPHEGKALITELQVVLDKKQ
ncbi:MAG: hypothetical protein ACLGH8_11365 [Bacteroidia bacterium]